MGLVGGACEDVAQIFYRTAKYEKKDKLVSNLNEEGLHLQGHQGHPAGEAGGLQLGPSS